MKLDKMLHKPEAPVKDIPISDISIQRLIDDGLLVLFREITNLKRLSVSGKLEATDARDLRDHLKLLFELKDRESESLKGLTDDELKAKLDDNVQDQSPGRSDKP